MKIYHYIALLLVGLFFTSCYRTEIEELTSRVDAIEGTQIKSQQEQIAAINKSLPELEKTDKELKGYIETLQGTAAGLQKSISETNAQIEDALAGLDEDLSETKAEIALYLSTLKSDMEAELERIKRTITTLQEKDEQLEERIEELKGYVDTELEKNKDWADATFATLEQFNAIGEEIAGIKASILTLNQSITALETRMTETIETEVDKALAPIKDELVGRVIADVANAYMSAINSAKQEVTESYTTALASAISTLETSMKSWVSEQLKGYYTISEMNAKLEAMEQDYISRIADQKASLESVIARLSTELNELIADNKSLIDGLRKDVNDYAVMVADNAVAIAENVAKILDNTEAISTNKELIQQNSRLIAANTSAIDMLQESTGADIKANAESIAANAKNIAANASNIAKYAALITEHAEKIANNTKDIRDNATAIANLRNDLTATKEEITEAYTQAIQDALANNGSIDSSIAAAISQVNASVDAKIQQVAQKVAALESRMDQIEENIAELIARIQSVSYIPAYTDGKATVKYCGEYSEVTLDFEVSPKEAIKVLSKNWETALSLKAIYTMTRSVSFIEMPVIKFESDADAGVISVTASGENLSSEFLRGLQTASVRLAISDGNSSILSDYIQMTAASVSFEEISVVPDNEIWYTNGSTTKATEPYQTNTYGCFGAVLDSQKYDYVKSCWVMSFDRPITKIGDQAFYSKDLTAINIPETVIYIGDSAFDNCKKLTKIKLPESVTSLHHGAFYNCTALTKVELGSRVESIKDYAFYNCSELTSISLGKSLSGIGKNAFQACKALRDIDMPASVSLIGDSAFYDCDALTEVSIGNGVVTIEHYAFSACENLTTVIIPDSVKNIQNGVFNSCFKLTGIYCKATTPPSFGSYMYLKETTKIYVPAASVDAYKAASGWSEYSNLITGYNFN